MTPGKVETDIALSPEHTFDVSSFTERLPVFLHLNPVRSDSPKEETPDSSPLLRRICQALHFTILQIEDETQALSEPFFGKVWVEDHTVLELKRGD